MCGFRERCAWGDTTSMRCIKNPQEQSNKYTSMQPIICTSSSTCMQDSKTNCAAVHMCIHGYLLIAQWNTDPEHGKCMKHVDAGHALEPIASLCTACVYCLLQEQPAGMRN